MIMKSTILFVCFVFLVIQHGSEAIRCYQCAVGSDGCGPSFDETGSGVISTINATHTTYCVKRVYASNENAVERSQYSPPPGNCTENVYYSNNGATYRQYCCSTDLCNTASTGKANFIAAIFTSIFTFLFIQ